MQEQNIGIFKNQLQITINRSYTIEIFRMDKKCHQDVMKNKTSFLPCHILQFIGWKNSDNIIL